MSGWLTIVIAVSVLALSAALVLAILSARRVLERAAAILGVVERELGPLAAKRAGSRPTRAG